jgi:tetratricopeptide (TPR) repeat protein
MISKKLNVILVMAGLSFSSGCASSGLKMPSRDTFASLDFRKSQSGSELSPEFREAQKIFKVDPEGSLVKWARWQEDVGEYGEARKKYREILVAYPENIDAQLGLARIELSCGRVKQAEDILLEVAAKRPTNAPVRLELGRLYTHQEDWDKAIAAFEDASAIDRENQVCRYELGIAFARCHRYDQALAHLTYAVGESGANYNIGYILHEQGNDAEAAEWFQNALQSHPDPQTAEKTRAMLAQLDPNNSRDRNSPPTYPTASPSSRDVAIRSKQATIDQFEPASFEAPKIQAASTSRVQPSGEVLPYVSSETNSQQSAQPSVLLPPVNQQPAQYGMASQNIQPTANPVVNSPFKTVSHSVPQGPVSQPTASGNQPPQWHGAGQQTPVTQGASPGPTKWRGR